MNDPYASTLRGLHAAGLPFVVIGTYALRAYYPEALSDYALPDCDLVIAPDHLNPAIAFLLPRGWALHLWEAPVTGPLAPEEAAGKFYLRARKGGHTLDLTYECALPWPEILALSRVWLGIPLADLSHIQALKRLKGSPKDLALLERLSHLEPIVLVQEAGNA
jgi:hypothetical protein